MKEYLDQAKQQHKDVLLNPAGFFICDEYQQLGASPDATVMCKCCGFGCVEVKCPYLLQELTLEEFAQRKTSCLVHHGAKFSLDRKHIYYYQIQLQMFITKAKYCDFVIWSTKDLFVERIIFDKMFFEDCRVKH